MKSDPVCGMEVEDGTKYHAKHDGYSYHFCSASCLSIFLKSPTQYLSKDKGEKSGCGCKGKKTLLPEQTTKPHSCCGGSHKPDANAELMAGTSVASGKAVDESVIYTCPMHPEIEQQGPGSCPKCGMAL